MTISIAIQSHPARSDLAEGLLLCIPGAEIVYDPMPDDGLKSPWRTYRAALEATPADADYRLVVQDDVVVCDYFREGVEWAVAARPGRVLVFFVAGNPLNHQRAVLGACDRGETWVELDLRTWIPAVATLWPAALARELPGWFDRQGFPPAFIADDEIIGRFLRARGEHPLACAPSLVEHPDVVPSLVHGYRRRTDGLDLGRRAACWIGDGGGCDARALDWTTGAG